MFCTGSKPCGFLHLGPSIRQYTYRGLEQFWGLYERELNRQKEGTQVSEWILFTNVDERTFIHDFLKSPDKTIRGS